MIRDARHHQPHIHAAVGGQAQRAHHCLVDGEIRRRDIDGLVCGGNQVQKRVLGGVDGVVVRPVAQRLAEARTVDMQLRTVVVHLLLE